VTPALRPLRGHQIRSRAQAWEYVELKTAAEYVRAARERPAIGPGEMLRGRWDNL